MQRKIIVLDLVLGNIMFLDLAQKVDIYKIWQNLFKILTKIFSKNIVNDLNTYYYKKFFYVVII